MTAQHQTTKVAPRNISVQTRQADLRESELETQRPPAIALQGAAADPRSASPAAILQLQRSYGNRAVSNLIQTKLTVGPAGDKYEQEADRIAEQVMRMQSPAAEKPLQRQEEEEEELQMKPLVQRQTPEEEEELQMKPLVQRQTPEDEEELQMKPLVQRQTPEDEEELQLKPLVQRQAPEEEEELQMKPLVQRQAPEEEEELQMKPSPQLRPLFSQQSPIVNRKSSIQNPKEGFETNDAFHRSLSASKGNGSPLPDQLRADFEPKFGADFGGVRAHSDSNAAQLNRQINAQAFTHGNDIFFGAGKYNPGSSSGKQLIAHELTHTIQQTKESAKRLPANISRSFGLQRGMVQRAALPSVVDWKKYTKLKWKRRSGRLRKIDQALDAWHEVKNGNAQNKLRALNRLQSKIEKWQATKKEGGKQSKRNMWIRMLKKDVQEMLAGLQPGGQTATLTLNVDVESDDPMNRTFGDLRHSKVGHAWITLKYDTPGANRLANAAGFNAQNKAALQAGTPEEASFGFYPEKFRSEDELKQLYYGTLDMTGMGSSALLQPDDRHQAKAQKNYGVTDAAVTQVGDFVAESKGEDYQMHGYNCTSFALGVIRAAGHKPPSAKLRGIHQPNKLYRGLHRLKKAGDTSVNDRVELARNTIANQNKTYTNLTPQEAKAIMLVTRDHPTVRAELGLHDIENDIAPALRDCWTPMDENRKARVENSGTRMAEFSAMIGQYVGFQGRQFAMQMAALLQDEDSFDMWLNAVSLPLQMDLTRAILENDNKTYNNITQKEAEAIMRVTIEQDDLREELGLYDGQEITNKLWDIWDTYVLTMDRGGLIRTPGTRLATIRTWVQAYNGNDTSAGGRKLNMQIVALVMDTPRFDKWLRWAESQ